MYQEEFQLENRKAFPKYGLSWPRAFLSVDSGMPLDEDRELAQEGDSGSFFQRGKGMDKVIYIHYLLSEQIIIGVSS